MIPLRIENDVSPIEANVKPDVGVLAQYPIVRLPAGLMKAAAIIAPVPSTPVLASSTVSVHLCASCTYLENMRHATSVDTDGCFRRAGLNQFCIKNQAKRDENIKFAVKELLV